MEMNDSQISVRWARMKDCAGMATLELASAVFENRREPITLKPLEFAQLWKVRLNSGTHHVLLAEKGREILGFLSFGHDMKAGEVNALYVAPSHMRQGVGSTLVRVASELMRTLHGKRLWVEVEPGNHFAMQFYRKLGFIGLGQDAVSGLFSYELPLTGDRNAIF